MTALIFDKSKKDAFNLEKILSEKDLNVISSFDIDNIFSKILENKPDLIFVDIDFLDLNFSKICTEIKTSASFAHIPVFILTNGFFTPKLSDALKAGANDFITKPYIKEIVNARISEYLRNYSLIKSSKKAEKDNQSLIYQQISEQLIEAVNIQRTQILGLKSAIMESKNSIFFIKEKAVHNCNSKALKLFCFDSTDDILGRNIFNYSPEFQPDNNLSVVKSDNIFADSFACKNSYRFNWTFINNKGFVFSVNASMRYVSENEIILSIKEKEKVQNVEVVFNNNISQNPYYSITPSKQNPDQILSDYSNIKTFLGKKDLYFFYNNSPSIILIIDKNENIIEINKTGLRVLSKLFTKPVLLSQLGDVFSCVGSLQSRQGCGFGLECKKCHLRKILTETINKKRNFSKINTKLYVLHNGKKKELNILFSTRVLQNDNNIQFMVIIDDITKLKQAEDSYKKLNKKLNEANEQKSQFISILSHDIRARIVEISTSICLIEKHKFKDFEQKYFKLLKRGVDNTLLLLDELLKWGRIIVGKEQINQKAFKAEEVFDETKSLFSDSLQAKNIKLEIDHPKDIQIKADRNLFSVLVRNLINNAIKFSYNNSSIQISTKIVYNSKQKLIEYCFSDAGIGIKRECLKELFTSYNKNLSMGTNGERGTGFGLLLCKEIVEKHNGLIWVESKLGKGSRFYFTFPLHNDNYKNKEGLMI